MTLSCGRYLWRPGDDVFVAGAACGSCKLREVAECFVFVCAEERVPR